MSVPAITFFNNKGGVGETFLVYHVAWMMADMGFRVLAGDLDPQGNLTAAFLDENRLEQIWEQTQSPATIYKCVSPLKNGVGDVAAPVIEKIDDNLALIPGDMNLLYFEEDLAQAWPKCLDRDERAFRVTSAFWRVLQSGASEHKADIILIDVGPNLGAINRAALIASDCVVIPLGPDLFSLQGLRNLGPTLIQWRTGWKERLGKKPLMDLPMPEGRMEAIGYIVIQHSIRNDRPLHAYQKWISRIPGSYREHVLKEKVTADVPEVSNDPHCFQLVKHYRSLMPMAQEANKPIFHLKPADGAIGSHAAAVLSAGRDFEDLAKKILERAGKALQRPITR